jgi:YfiH family protein
MPIILVDMPLPKPNGEFVWVQEPWGAALRCDPLFQVARHCFTSTELKLEGAKGDGGWAQLARSLGVEIDALVRLRQVHGVDVFEVEKKAEWNPAFDKWPQADIAVTANPSMALSVRAADCVPILLADRRSGAVAAVHAGWRGTAAGAAIVAVRALAGRFDTKPGDVIAAVGPSIGPCCYQVGLELIPRFDDHAAGHWFSHARDAKPHLNLWRATRDQLAGAGVPDTQIYVCELCTSDHPSLLPSYRRDGQRAGRLVAAIRSGPGRTL